MGYCGKSFFVVFLMFLCLSCGKLQVDDTLAYRLLQVSQAQTPATEEIRSFIQYQDRIYAAAGSGGILVYRVVGDAIESLPRASLTNLYSEDLEPLYIRTLEIVETEMLTNLIFGFDTISGGGVGLAEINPDVTKLIGSLEIIPNLRIRNTITTLNPDGKFHIMIADEQTGIVSYELSISSNSFFEQPKVADLVDYISLSELQLPSLLFQPLEAPGGGNITNISQISNLEALIKLAYENKELFSQIVTNIPFLTDQQRAMLQQAVDLQDQPIVSNIVDAATKILKSGAADQILQNPSSVLNLLENGSFAKPDSNLLNQLIQTAPPMLTNITDIGVDLSSNDQRVTLEDFEEKLSNKEAEGTPFLSPLLQLSQSKDVKNFLNNPNMSSEPNLEPQEAETLYFEYYLSNLSTLLGEKIDIDKLHDKTYDPFTNRQSIGIAGREIEKTIQALGRKFFMEDSGEFKSKFYEFSQMELKTLFESVFTQADLMTKLIPLFLSSGVDVKQLYSLWKNQQYFDIIELLDPSVLAEIFRLLPRYSVDMDLQLKSTNTEMPGIRSLSADENTIYAATGTKGFSVIDRISGKIIASHSRPFSEVSMVVPYQIYGRKYFVVADKLDGLLLYRRERNNKIGELVSRISLVGEAFSVYPFEDLLWVADGSDGVLGIRFNKDESLIIEAENYNKSGIAYFIGSARRREVLVSYGSDGLVRLRITNIEPDRVVKESDRLDKAPEQTQDFIDRTLQWGRYSPIAKQLRKMLFL